MNILLVENDSFISELLTEVLTERNFIVEAVFNGLAPLQLVKKKSYDLIILNVILPKLDGINICRQLRDEGYRMPILFWTSQDAPEIQWKAIKAGADDYIVKPCKLNILLGHINRLLNHNPVRPKLEIDSETIYSDYLQLA